MSQTTAPAYARQPTPILGVPPTTRPPTGPLAEFGRTLREEFGQAFARFQTLQRDASDELLLFGMAHPEMREEMLAVLEHELDQAAGAVRLARRFGIDPYAGVTA